MSMSLFLLQQGGNALLETLPMIALMFGIFYFVLFRPQMREKKAQEAMRTQLKKGDEVLTQGGIVAKVQQVKDKMIVLDLDGSSRMTVVRESIIRRLGDQADPKAKPEKEEAAASGATK